MQVVTTNPLFFWLLATSTSILTTFGMNMVSSTHSLLSPARARGVWGAPALAPNCLGLAPPLTSWPNLLSRSPRVLSPRHRSTPPSGRDCWHGVDAGTHFYAGLAYAIICCSHPHLVLCLPGLISLGLSHGSHLTATSRNRHGLTPLSHQPLSLRRFEYDFELHATFCTKPRNEFEMASILSNTGTSSASHRSLPLLPL
jgi:hypothetical protein